MIHEHILCIAAGVELVDPSVFSYCYFFVSALSAVCLAITKITDYHKYVCTDIYMYVYIHQLTHDLSSSQSRFRKSSFCIIWIPQIAPIPLNKTLIMKSAFSKGLTLENIHRELLPWLEVRCLIFMLDLTCWHCLTA